MQISTFFDDLWGPLPVSDEMPMERRRSYSDLGERVVRVETKLDTSLGEQALLRPVVHRLVSEVSSLVMQGEQQQRDHKTMMDQLLRFNDHLEQHDQRDDNRFEAANARIAAVEKEIGVVDTHQQHQRAGSEHRLLWLLAIVSLAGVIISGFLASLPLWFGK